MRARAMDWAADTDPADRRRSVPAFRTLLAGGFAAPGGPGRRRLEGMLATRTGRRAHQVLPGCRALCQIEQAETQLASHAVDIVVLDLDGPVEAMLSLVGRLRRAAGHGVIFVGILALHATAAARLYLSAVMDEVVDDPMQAGSLHRAIADALRMASEFQYDFGDGSIAVASGMRH